MTIHYVIGNKNIKGVPRCLRFAGAFFLDLITLIFRLISLIPRAVYQCCQKPETKLAHTIKTITGKDNLPIMVVYRGRGFDFALVPMHEIQANNYFKMLASYKAEEGQVVEE